MPPPTPSQLLLTRDDDADHDDHTQDESDAGVMPMTMMVATLTTLVSTMPTLTKEHRNKRKVAWKLQVFKFSGQRWIFLRIKSAVGSYGWPTPHDSSV